MHARRRVHLVRRRDGGPGLPRAPGHSRLARQRRGDVRRVLERGRGYRGARRPLGARRDPDPSHRRRTAAGAARVPARRASRRPREPVDVASHDRGGARGGRGGRVVVQVVFFVAALGALGGAIAVVALRNPFYSVLALVVHLVSLAALFLLLHAQFVAAAQIVVYAGAVMVLYVFVAAFVLAARRREGEGAGIEEGR